MSGGDSTLRPTQRGEGGPKGRMRGCAGIEIPRKRKEGAILHCLATLVHARGENTCSRREAPGMSQSDCGDAHETPGSPRRRLTMAGSDALIGTWKMVSWKRKIVATMSEQSDIAGPDPVGFINYGSDGRFMQSWSARTANLRRHSLPATTRNLGCSKACSHMQEPTRWTTRRLSITSMPLGTKPGPAPIRFAFMSVMATILRSSVRKPPTHIPGRKSYI